MKAGQLILAGRASSRIAVALGLLIVWAVAVPQAQATIIGGIDFPNGALAFADVVHSYTPVVQPDPRVVPSGLSPDPAYQTPGAALGVPDFVQNPSGLHYPGLFCSLGNGGVLELEFTDNVLAGSGTPAAELYIFEVGPLVEQMFVWISKDSVTWHYLTLITGGTFGVDIDAFGWGPSDHFRYIRIQDDPTDAGGQTDFLWHYSGADIDAVGVIPEPATAMLLALGGAGMLWMKRRRR